MVFYSLNTVLVTMLEMMSRISRSSLYTGIIAAMFVVDFGNLIQMFHFMQHTICIYFTGMNEQNSKN